MARYAFVVVGTHLRHQLQRVVGDDVGGVGVVAQKVRPHLLQEVHVLGLLVPHQNGVRTDVLLVVVEAAAVLLLSDVLIDDFPAFVRHAGVIPGPAEVHHVAGHEHIVLHLVDALVIGAVALVVPRDGHVDKGGVESVLDFLFRDPQFHSLIQELVPVFLHFRKLLVEDRGIEVSLQFRRFVGGSGNVGEKESQAFRFLRLKINFVTRRAPWGCFRNGQLIASEGAVVGIVYGGGDASLWIILVESYDQIVP